MENNYRMSELGFWVPVRESRDSEEEAGFWVPNRESGSSNGSAASGQPQTRRPSAKQDSLGDKLLQLQRYFETPIDGLTGPQALMVKVRELQRHLSQPIDGVASAEDPDEQLAQLEKFYAAWDPAKHPRGGNPENTGQFSKVPGASSATAERAKRAGLTNAFVMAHIPATGTDPLGLAQEPGKGSYPTRGAIPVLNPDGSVSWVSPERPIDPGVLKEYAKQTTPKELGHFMHGGPQGVRGADLHNFGPAPKRINEPWTPEQRLDALQFALDALGLVPVVGNLADLLNAGISYARGDKLGAGLSLASAISVVGLVGKAAKLSKVTKVARLRKIVQLAEIAEEVGQTTRRVSPETLERLAQETQRARAALKRAEKALAKTALDREAKDAFRTSAREIWEEKTGRPAIWDGLEVHHRIPLEWSHMFPSSDPNRLSNLLGMKRTDHLLVSEAWNGWRRALNGRIPSQGEILTQALRVDERFGHLMKHIH